MMTPPCTNGNRDLLRMIQKIIHNAEGIDNSGKKGQIFLKNAFLTAQKTFDHAGCLGKIHASGVALFQCGHDPAHVFH